MQLAQTITSKPEVTEQTFKGVDGITIFSRSWRPAAKPRGVVVIAPGFNSHSGQYGWVAEQLVAADLAVYAIDHRGRGKSEGERFHVEKFAADVGAERRLWRELGFGHSLARFP